MKKNLFIFILFLFSSNAFAKSGSLTMEANVKSTYSVFEADIDKEGSYKEVTSNILIETSFKGSGALKHVNEKDSQTNTDVVGIDLEGYSKISLKEKSGKVYLHIRTKLEDTVEGIEIKSSSDYLAEAEFTLGNFEAFKNGEVVELRLTKEGQKLAINNTIQELRIALENARQELKKQVDVSEIKVISAKSKGLTTIKGDLDRLEVRGGSLKIKMAFSAKI
jgi:hypothetical protein